MSYLLSKLLPVFVYPLGLTIILCLLGAVLVWNGFKRSAILSVLMAAVLLWVSSTSVFADFLMGTLESSYPPVVVEDLPKADAIVILGGMTRGVVPDSEITDLGGSVDRLFYGANLYKEKKASVVILSGGNAKGFVPEAELMRGILEQLGVPAEHMFLENKSRNTYQNAVNTLKIMKKHGVSRILLVTSASHMKRAAAAFEAIGIVVIPASADYQVVNKEQSIVDWLPSSEALDRTTKGIKEYIGWWVYSARGWV